MNQIQTKISQLEVEMAEKKRLQLDGEAELKRLELVRQVNMRARAMERAQLATKAREAREKAERARVDLLAAQDDLERRKKENRRRKDLHDGEIATLERDVQQAASEARMRKQEAEKKLDALIRAKASKAEVDAAAAVAKDAKEKAELLAEKAEKIASEADAARLRARAAFLEARKAALAQEEECRRLQALANKLRDEALLAAKQAKAGAEAERKKALAARADASQKLSAWTEAKQRADKAAEATAQAQKDFDAAQALAVTARVKLNKLERQLAALKSNPPAYLSTDELVAKITDLEAALATAKQQAIEADARVAEAKKKREQASREEKAAIAEQKRRNQQLTAELTRTESRKIIEEKRRQEVEIVIVQIKQSVVETNEKRKVAQKAWDDYRIAYKRQLAVADEEKIKRIQVVKAKNAADKAVAESALRALDDQLAARKRETDDAGRVAEAADQTLKNKQAEVDALNVQLQVKQQALAEATQRVNDGTVEVVNMLNQDTDGAIIQRKRALARAAVRSSTTTAVQEQEQIEARLRIQAQLVKEQQAVAVQAAAQAQTTPPARRVFAQ